MKNNSGFAEGWLFWTVWRSPRMLFHYIKNYKTKKTRRALDDHI